MASASQQQGPSRSDLKRLVQVRLKDAEVLLAAGRYDFAAYACGYVLEMALKACVCRRLRLREYPGTGSRSLDGVLKTHEFDVLLSLAGLKDEVSSKKQANLARWSTVADWRPEWRYKPAGTTLRQDAEDRIEVLRKEVLAWLRKRW